MTGGARDVRRGERWTAFQSVKNLAIAAAVRAGFRIADRLPAPLLLSLCRALGRAAARVLPRERRRAFERASAALPRGRAEHVARACFERAGENLGTSLLLRRPGFRALDRVRVSEAARAILSRALARGRGAVVVSAHLGPFELVAAAVAELGFAPAVVVRESYDPRLDAWVDAHRIARGIRVIHRGSKGAALAIVRNLRAGRPVGFLPDLGSRVPAARTRFLGARTAFPVGPQVIAARAGAPLLVGWLRRESSSSSGPAFSLELLEVDGDAEPEEMTQRVASALSAAILGSSPEDWLWMGARPSPAGQSVIAG